MWWEPLAEWGPLDSDFGDLSPPPNHAQALDLDPVHHEQLLVEVLVALQVGELLRLRGLHAGQVAEHNLVADSQS